MRAFIRLFVLLIVSLQLAYPDGPGKTVLRFAWFTDTHVGSPSGARDLRGVVADVNQQDSLAFVLISGDISETDTGNNLWLAKRILDSLTIPYHIIPGNHDTKWSASGATLFSRLWGDDRFDFEVGEYRFIGLHQGPLLRMGDGYIDPADIRWVAAILNSLPDPRQKIFIVMHYPLNPAVDNWYALMDVIRPFNIQAVLHGHGHANKTQSFEGIPGIMSRSTLNRGSQPSGYTLVELSADQARFSERIPQADSLRIWHTLVLGERDYSDSLRLPRPDYSANDTSGVALLWQVSTGAILTVAPVAYDNKVFVSSTDGSVTALDQASGKQLWQWQGQGAIHSTPAIKGTRLVIGSSDSSITCLSTADGQLKWQTSLSGPVLASPLIHKNRVYIGTGNGSFQALNLRNGKLKWTYSGIRGYIETRPVLVDRKVMFGAWDGSFYALNARKGSLVWQWSDGRPGVLYSPAACWPVAANGKVFIVAPDRAMTAISIANGSTIWRNTDHKVREMIGISEDGRSIYARTMQDTVFAVSSTAEAFRLKWKVNAGYGYDFAPSMMIEKDAHLFFGTKDGWIYCLASSDGAVLWKYRVSDGLINTVHAIDGDHVLTTAADGKVSLLGY